jgi:N-acetylglucosamine repressor
MKKATRQHTKNHNKRLILKTIYDRGSISRASVARLTRLARTTVSDAVAELMEEQLVEEIGHGPSVGGKPPILLSIVASARCLIGVDLLAAGNEFRGGVLDLRGKIIHSSSVAVIGRDSETALQQMYELIDRLVAACSSPILGIGIGMPGLMDTQRGIVRKTVNLDWQEFPLKDLLETRYRLPVYVANDSQLAALGEYTFGNGQKSSNLVVVKVGRGTSAGIVLNGQLHYGDRFGAGEIGHVAVVENGEPCLCGNYGCLETVASSRAIIKRAKAIAQSDPHSTLHRFATRPEEITTEVILQAFQAGDEALQQLITEVGRYLGIVVANMVGILNVERILISGSLARFGETLLEPIRQVMRQRALSMLANETQVDLGTLGQDSVIQGAAALILSHELGLV